MTDTGEPLVGRHPELQSLERMLEGASAGAARFAFITGEPGIGKTRLLAELTERADGRGCLTLTGRAAEFERELPFGLVVDAFDEYLESLGPGEFSRLPAEDAAELAGVFPSLRSLDPGSGRPRTAAERFRAHRAVRDLMQRLASSQPLVLALDDLHWADEASIELLSHLLRRPPRAGVLVAATFRAGQARRELETAVEAAGADTAAVRRIAVGPLSPDEAQALLDAEPAESERLYEASGGNPLYLLQLARFKGPDRPSVAADGASDVPPAVVTAIAGELDVLPEAARRLADAAAVAGDPFELDLAVAAAGMPDRDALDALDELIARELVRAGEVPRRFHFRHPLVRRAVYESCPPGARLAAHERCANALAARGASPAVRAYHVQHSARHGDTEAVAVLRDAGLAAAHRAPASAARWFGAALALLPADAGHGERVELLTALAGACSATGRFEDARDALLESIELTPAGDEAQRVRLVGACARVEQLLGEHEDADERLAAALARLSDTSSPQAVELMIQLGVGDFYRMDYGGMRSWGERALAVATGLGDAPLRAAATAVLAVAESFMGAISESRAHTAEAATLVDGMSDEELGLRLDAVASLSTAELYLHRYADAAEHAERGLSIAGAIGQGELSPVLVPVLSHALHMTGRIAESGELLDGAVEASRLSGNVEALGWNLLSGAFTSLAAGDVELALDLARESVDLTRELDDSLVSVHAGVALASALFESGEPHRAIDVLTEAAGGKELPLIADGWRPNYLELLTRCQLAAGQIEAAARSAARTAEAARATGLYLAAAMAHRAVAAVTLDRGQARAAANRALASAAAADEVGARVEAARSRALAGRALALAGERERAIGELERAAAELEACGADRYRRQAELELRKLGRHIHRRTRPGSAGAGLGSLTEREAEIARLVAERHTNPEIAGVLVLSVKTIETHMHNIFRKLDVSSRVEVARAVERGA